MLFLYLVASSGRGLDLLEGAMGDCLLFIALFIDGGFLRSSVGLTISDLVMDTRARDKRQDYESLVNCLTY